LLLINSFSIAYAQEITFVEIIDTFDENETRYAYAYLVADFSDGRAILIDDEDESIGFLAYKDFHWAKDITISVSFRVSNDSVIAMWITSTDVVDYIGDEITPDTDLRKVFVGAGISVALTKSIIYLRQSDARGVTHGSLFYAASSESYSFERSEDYADYYVTLKVSRVSESKWMVTIYLGNTQIYSGNIWNIEPTYIAVVGGGKAFSHSVYIDIVSIIASSFSPYEVIVPTFPSPAIAVAPSLLIMPHNSTALYILYMCYYRTSPSECPIVTVSLYADSTLIYNKTIECEETESHLYTFRDIVVVDAEEIEYKVYIDGELYSSGTISIPAIAPLYTNPFTELIAVLIPIAVAISLGVKTSSIRNIGLGFIAAGLVIMLLPLLGIYSSNLYVGSMLCIAIGGLILFFYKTQ